MFDVAPIHKQQLAAALRAMTAPETLIRVDEPLARRTTLRVGGPADIYLEPVSEQDLARVVRFCRESDVALMILGRGSNLLVRDAGIRGVVVSLAQDAFSRIDVADGLLRCGAGARLKQVAVVARRHNLSGLEFLEGIPGSVGGALRMNAGAMGGATFDIVERVRVMDRAGDIREFSASEVPVRYRCCPMLKANIALGAVLKGVPASAEQVAAQMKCFSEKRWDSQPAAPSAGCIFKNPATIPAGKLVDELGLKGTRVGGAAVSDVHGNFIVNEGNATAADVLQLIEIVRERARRERGIELETEVEVVGD